MVFISSDQSDHEMLTTFEMQEKALPEAAYHSNSNSILKQPVFQIGNQTYCWEEIFFSAKLSGQWLALEKRVVKGIACQKKLAELEEELNEQLLDEACESFRYEKDLIAAEELEEWLKQRGISVEEWIESMERKVLTEQWSDDLDQIVSDYPVSSDEAAEAINVEGICGGDFQRFAFDLAAQAALCAGANGITINQDEIRAFLRSFPAEIRYYREIERLAELKLASDGYRRDRITEKKVRERIQSHSLDYIHFDLQTLTFETESEASEAALCIREDGETPSSLSAVSGTAFAKRSCYATELEPEILNEIVCAQPGECIGPLRNSQGEFLVIHVDAKDAPLIDDPDLQKQAQEALFQTVRNNEVNQWVRWYATL